MNDRDLALLARLEQLANGESNPFVRDTAAEAVLLLHDLHNRLALTRYQLAVMERDMADIKKPAGETAGFGPFGDDDDR